MFIKHGMYKYPEYPIWQQMNARCRNPRHPKYHRYGGRGITVCAEWRTNFATFLRDVGRRPIQGLTIDRIDNDGNYEPGNVRWSTPKEQQANGSCARKIVFNGEYIPRKEACRRAGILFGTFQSRLRYGWTIEEALSNPVGTSWQLRNIRTNASHEQTADTILRILRKGDAK